jgi:hypothetical protein
MAIFFFAGIPLLAHAEDPPAPPAATTTPPSSPSPATAPAPTAAPTAPAPAAPPPAAPTDEDRAHHAYLDAEAAYKLNHFGEAARYLEYNLSLLAPVAIAYCASLDETGFEPMLGSYALWVAFLVLRNYRGWLKLPMPEKDELGEFLEPLKLSAKDTIYPIPFTLGGSICVRAPEVRAIMCQGAAISPDLYRKFTEEPPMLKKNWWPLFDEFNVTYVIGLEIAVKQLKSYLGWEYDFSRLVKVGDANGYVAYKIPPRREWPEGGLK